MLIGIQQFQLVVDDMMFCTLSVNSEKINFYVFSAFPFKIEC